MIQIQWGEYVKKKFREKKNTKSVKSDEQLQRRFCKERTSAKKDDMWGKVSKREK